MFAALLRMDIFFYHGMNGWHDQDHEKQDDDNNSITVMLLVLPDPSKNDN